MGNVFKTIRQASETQALLYHFLLKCIGFLFWRQTCLDINVCLRALI